ncbi:MAG: hypothetical protein QOE11_2004 [Solirubrobacteraceae bacterium]|nr:hypothetical protein [Solirubrobacteraceae bacterium]
MRRVVAMIAGVVAAAAVLVLALFVVPAPVRPEHGESGEGEGSLRAFAGERAGIQSRRLPIAVVRDQLEKGREAGRESVSGPAQAQVDERAYPRTYVETKRALAARRAFRDAPSRLPASAFRRSARAVAQRAALAADWSELGPVTPNVPGAVTYTGAPATVSGRVTALVVDPSCGAPGKGCRMWVAAAGGGIFRTADALAATVVWTPSSTGLTSFAIGSLVSDPTDPSGNTLYAGTGEANGSSDSEAGVGLFRSSDGGATWSLVPGSAAVAHDRGIATIAIDPANSAHVFIGTAVARHGIASVNGGRRTPPGAPQLGLYETTDGGASFALAFSKPPDPTPADTGNDFFTGSVNEVMLDPNDSSVVYAAVTGYGIWRRSAGTATFAQVFATKFPADTVDPAAAPADFFGDRTEFDLADLGATTRMYLGDSSDDNVYSALWRTDNAGQAAANLVTPGTATTNPANRAPAYVLLSDPDIANTAGFTSFNFCQGQCGYDIVVKADPRNPDTVYLGGSMNYEELFGATGVSPQRTNGRAVVRSSDAGVSFTDMTNEAGPTIQDDPSLPADQLAQGMHPDQHALVFSPANAGATERVFVGSDGGVVRTSGAFADDSARCDQRQAALPVDATFTPDELALCRQALSAVPTGLDPLNDGLRTIQFQSLSVNQADPVNDVLGGTQDNGTWAFTGGPAWFESVGGDGGQSAIDPAAGARVHTYFGPTMDVNFHGDDPATWDYISEPLDNANVNCGSPDPASECFSFYVPMIDDPVTPGTLFTGGEYVWRTQDDGGDRTDLDAHCRETAFTVGDGTAVCGDWTRLGGARGHIGTPGNYIVATERTPADAGTLWVGRRRGGVFVSNNADAANVNSVRFTQISTPAIPDRFVSSIHVDPADADHAWVSFSGYEAYTPGQPGHVFEVRFDRAAGTATWTDLSGTTGDPGAIGDQPVTDLVRDDPTGDLYAATDFGVLRRPNGAAQWEQAAGNLPPVAVYGLTIAPGGRLLYAATHGRGAWRVALPPAPAAPPGPAAPGVPVPAAAAAPPAPAAGPEAPPQGTPVPATRRPVIGRLSARRSGQRVVTVRIGLARTSRLTLVIRDPRNRVIGRRTAKIKRDDLLNLHVTVRPRGTQTVRTRWRVTATATARPGLTRARTASFRARR